VTAATNAKIEFVSQNGSITVLKEKVPLEAGEVVDASFMSKNALVKFLEEQVTSAKTQDVLFSLHMKATMMKVSDPIIFGHCVKVFYKDVVEKHAETIKELGVNFNISTRTVLPLLW